MSFFKPGLVKATLLVLLCTAGMAASSFASARDRHHGGHGHHNSDIALAIGLGALAYSAGRHDSGYYYADPYYPRYRARPAYYAGYYDYGYYPDRYRYARPVVYYGNPGYYRGYGHHHHSRRHYNGHHDGYRHGGRHYRDGYRDRHH